MVQPTVEEYATYCLYEHAVPMTVAEIRADIDYSHGYTREALRDLRSRGEIEGEKTKPVVACNVHGTSVVFTSSREGMLESLEDAPTDIAARARSSTSGVEDLQRFIRQHGSGTYQIERRWKFWYPKPAPGTSSSPAAAADD